MRKLRLCAAILLILALTLTGCNDTGSVYKSLGTLTQADFAIGFRADDKVCDYVTAALKVLKANGSVSELSVRWFGRDDIDIKGDETALDEFYGEDGSEIPERVFIVGLDAGAPPMSFRDSQGNYTGFDVELAGRVCQLLGWELRFMAINPADVKVELKSGNIDCAWGGMTFTADGDADVRLTEPYLKNEKVLVTLTGSGIRSKRGLKDKVLGMTFGPADEAALGLDSDLRSSLASIKKLDGAEALFASLLSSGCDVIVADSVTFDYYR